MNAANDHNAYRTVIQTAFLAPAERRTTSVCFIISDGFDALSLSSAIAPMRAVNEAADFELFAWHFCAGSAGAVRSSDGWSVEVAGLGDAVAMFDFILLVGASVPDGASTATLQNYVRHAWRLGKTVGAMRGAIFTLARSGILDGQRFVVHGDLAAAFSIEWPDLRPTLELYAHRNRICTCAGGASAADMMLQIVQDRLGCDFRREAMQTCVFPGFRPGSAPQNSTALTHAGNAGPTFLKALRWIEAHYLEDDCLSRLPSICELSSRQIQRFFQKCLGTTPKAYLTELRLRRAVSLLTITDLPINDVALECGYDITSTFSKAFSQRFGTVPSRFRDLRK